MPKTSVHKNNDSLFSKYKIRLPQERLFSPPTFDAGCLKDFDESQLSFFVTAGPNAGHYVRTLFL